MLELIRSPRAAARAFRSARFADDGDRRAIDLRARQRRRACPGGRRGRPRVGHRRHLRERLRVSRMARRADVLRGSCRPAGVLERITAFYRDHGERWRAGAASRRARARGQDVSRSRRVVRRDNVTSASSQASGWTASPRSTSTSSLRTTVDLGAAADAAARKYFGESGAPPRSGRPRRVLPVAEDGVRRLLGGRTLSGRPQLSNDEVAEFAAANADVAMPFASINPHRGADGRPRGTPARVGGPRPRTEAAPALQEF